MDDLMQLRGQSITNSHICLHDSQCLLYGAQVISLVSIMHVMIQWQWHEIKDKFIHLMCAEIQVDIDEDTLGE